MTLKNPTSPPWLFFTAKSLSQRKSRLSKFAKNFFSRQSLFPCSLVSAAAFASQLSLLLLECSRHTLFVCMRFYLLFFSFVRFFVSSFLLLFVICVPLFQVSPLLFWYTGWTFLVVSLFFFISICCVRSFVCLLLCATPSQLCVLLLECVGRTLFVCPPRKRKLPVGKPSSQPTFPSGHTQSHPLRIITANFVNVILGCLAKIQWWACLNQISTIQCWVQKLPHQHGNE